MQARSVFTIPAGLPFLPALARGLLARVNWRQDPIALSRATVLLPTRRAVRAFGEVLLAAAEGHALILPRIAPLGDVDEDAFPLTPESGPLDDAPVIDPLRRQLVLARLVAALETRLHGHAEAAHCARLAADLARFLDECQTAEVDLARFTTLVDQEFAAHWQQTLVFLDVLRRQWPLHLAAEVARDPAAARNARLASLSARWQREGAEGPVIAAGSTGSIPATATLLATIAALPDGAVVLPGLDQTLAPETWEQLGPDHPQFGFKELLARLEVAPDAVAPWPVAGRPSPRARLVSAAMLPAAATDQWPLLLAETPELVADALPGLRVVTAPHQGAEALAIALALREALELPGKTAALVTPDRTLARRVAAELRRFGILIDDTAGEPLGLTPAGLFLREVMTATAEALAPVPLLALLRHPLARCGSAEGAHRRAVGALDLALRGLRPPPGLAALRARAAEHTAAGPLAGALIDRLAEAVAPLLALDPQAAHPLATLAAAHLATAEALARDEAGAADALWAGEAGEAAAALLEGLIVHGEETLTLTLPAYQRLFTVLAAARPVRPRGARHARVQIWGPLEARLLSADLIVLGGLAEGTWPEIPDTGPWANRTMRATLGLPAPERRIGQAAHDVAQLLCAPEVLCTRSEKIDGAPTTPSRWLARLSALCDGAGLSGRLGDAPFAAWARQIDMPGPAERRRPAERPAPVAPPGRHPARLSVTQIETWVRDPYAIYARHILKLVPLNRLDEAPDARLRGTLVHAVFQRFIERHAAQWPADALERLLQIADELFRDATLPASQASLWLARFTRAAEAFLADGLPRRAEVVCSHAEVEGTLEITDAGAPFTLSARADRLDLLSSGAVEILDYKTGTPPSAAQVAAGFSPQLPLEALILNAGGFAALGPRAAAGARYLHLSGGASAKDRILTDFPAIVAATAAGLRSLLARFAAGAPYVSCPRVKFLTASDDYRHLARFAEWSTAGEDE